MLYPSDFERRIGFDQIRELLTGLCISDLGKAEVSNISFSSDHAEIIRSLSETEEFRQILLSGEAFPSQDYYNTIPLLHHLRIENTFPEPEQLTELKLELTTWLEILRFFNGERAKKYPNLAELVDQNTGLEVRNMNASTKLDVRSKIDTYHESRISDPVSRIADPVSRIADPESRIADPVSRIADPVSRIADLITSVLDDKSLVRTSASKELGRIRTAVNRLQGGVERRMKQLVNEARKSGWIDEDADVTLRDGRLVIPFRSAHKRRIQGVVHDESATGQTVYLEPVELFEMNNEIRELHYSERREIVRILTDVADRIRPHIDEFLEMNILLGKIDFIRAKARFALDIGAALCSRVEEKPFLDWFKAVHPLLFLAHKKAKKNVVPLDISLNPEKRVLVVSGPNAGGKSICLKTVGLLQHMLQCGLLPPAREDSGFGIFRQILIDIGDDQSLENDLSTYTSKLLNMKHFLASLDDSSLFLIDEMGTGTDPSVGGAIAEAALISMAGSGAYGVVTTHYSNLKLLANSDTGYAIHDTRYEIGDNPSHDPALRIANRASRISYLGSRIQNGAMLFDTRSMKPLYILKQGKPGSSFAIEIAKSIGFPEEELKRASELIGGSQLDFEQQLQELEVEKSDVKKKATELQVADEFLAELISNYEKRMAEFERSKNEILQNAREEAQQLLQDSNKLIERTIKEIREAQAEKERTKAARSEIRDARDAVTPKSPEGDLLRFAGTPKPESRIPNPGSGSYPTKRPFTEIIANKQESFALTLDLRGKRADEAFMELQRFIDDAIMISINEVRILHGKGSGALREVTRRYLKSRKDVKNYHDEAPERGGAGVTVAMLNL